jgi:hypothetical protein
MKKGKMIWMAVIAALLLIPTMGWAQAKPISTVGLPATEPSFFVEGYVGGGAATKTGKALSGVTSATITGSASIPGDIDPYFLGGLKFGYWFTPQGTYAASWYTDWMKYLGFYTDFSYHRLSFSNQTGSFNITAPVAANGNFGFDTDGFLATWAFMFAGRYGFLPDSEVPFGRLQPYIAVGPAIFFSNQNFTANLKPPFGGGISPGNKDSVTVGLAAELGARYFVNKSISLEASFKYRYFSPSYTYSGVIFNNSYNIKAAPDFNLFSGQFGVAYHF